MGVKDKLVTDLLRCDEKSLSSAVFHDRHMCPHFRMSKEEAACEGDCFFIVRIRLYAHATSSRQDGSCFLCVRFANRKKKGMKKAFRHCEDSVNES